MHQSQFNAKFHELMHNVEHHVQAEEAEMFPLAEEELAEDLDEMSAEMQELKQELMASQLNPRSPAHPVQGTAPESLMGITMRYLTAGEPSWISLSLPLLSLQPSTR